MSDVEKIMYMTGQSTEMLSFVGALQSTSFYMRPHVIRSGGYCLLDYIPHSPVVVHRHFREPTASNFYHEAGCSRFLWNAGTHQQDHTIS
jgi:hypothetical protein